MLNRQVGVPTTDIVADTLQKMKGRPAPPNNPAGRTTLNPASVAHMILDSAINGTHYPGLVEAIAQARAEVAADYSKAPRTEGLSKRLLNPTPKEEGEWTYYAVTREPPFGGWSQTSWDNMRAAKNAATMQARKGDVVHIMHRGVFGVFEKYLTGTCGAAGKVVWSTPPAPTQMPSSGETQKK